MDTESLVPIGEAITGFTRFLSGFVTTQGVFNLLMHHEYFHGVDVDFITSGLQILWQSNMGKTVYNSGGFGLGMSNVEPVVASTSSGYTRRRSYASEAQRSNYREMYRKRSSAFTKKKRERTREGPAIKIVLPDIYRGYSRSTVKKRRKKARFPRKFTSRTSRRTSYHQTPHKVRFKNIYS